MLLPALGAARPVQLRASPRRSGAQTARRASGVSTEASRRDALIALPLLLSPLTAGRSLADDVLPASLYDLTVQQYGKDVPLSQFKGKNRNYPSLRMLYDKYHEQGLELLAFPVNQFGGQAPGSDEYERNYAFKKFGFAWPTVFDHVAALDKPTPQWEGPTETSPVYRVIKAAVPGELPWNYTKYLIGRDGVPLRRYSPADPLDQRMEEDIVLALAGKPLTPRRFGQ